MNKILSEMKRYIQVDGDLSLDIDKNKIITLYIEKKDVTIDILIQKEQYATINLFNIDSNLKINIKLDEEAKLDFINSSLNYKNMNYDMKIIHEINSESNIVNHGININNGIMKFNINGVVEKGKHGVILKQDNKIINFKDGQSMIRPILLIDEFDCYANHSAYISKFNNNDIFYLMSRGIKEKESIKLLTKSFLLGKMKVNDVEESTFVNKIYNIERNSDSHE